MSDPIKIPLTESQKNLLQSKELTCMVEPDMERALSTILSKDHKYFLYLYPKDLEDLIGTICFVSNHEEYNLKWVKQLDLLTAYLEKFLDEK
jgi:hypothetical protein